MLVGKRSIGGDAPCFVIAEAGVNHNADLVLARRLVDAAAAAGADAIKFQSFDPETLTRADAPKTLYQVAQTGRNETQLEMLRKVALSDDQTREIADHARALGIAFCSTPFDTQSADLLEAIGVPFYKISSGDVTHVPLLRHLGQRKKPIVLSTGMCILDEVSTAVRMLREAGAPDVAVLHCVSEYPAPPEEMNLLAMHTMRVHLDVPVGLSDHTTGTEVALAAVALGAKILEKHLTVDRSLPGPDHAASLEPDEFVELVRQVRVVEAALGDGIKRVAPSEASNRALVRRGIVAATDIAPGETLHARHIDCRRPEDGIPASEYLNVLGRKTKRPFKEGESITEGALE